MTAADPVIERLARRLHDASLVYGPHHGAQVDDVGEDVTEAFVLDTGVTTYVLGVTATALVLHDADAIAEALRELAGAAVTVRRTSCEQRAALIASGPNIRYTIDAKLSQLMATTLAVLDIVSRPT